jgi:hypothetical protein
MRRWPVVCLGMMLVAALIPGFGRVRATQAQELANVKGTIQAVRPDAGWWAIVPDADRGTRYAPDRLSDEFKKDGLRVVFSGRVKPVDPAVRSWGVPLELTSIRRE